MFYRFFQLSCKVLVFIHLSFSFIFIVWFIKARNSTIWKVLFFLLTKPRSSLLAGIGWSVFISNYYYYYHCYYYFIYLRDLHKPMVFHLSLNDGKSHQVSSTFLSILTYRNNVVVWMVSTRPLISKSSSPSTNLWWLYRAHRLKLVSPLLSCYIAFSNFALWIYHLFIWSNLNFLQNSQLIPFPFQLCLVLYSFCTNLLHSLIMWLVGWLVGFYGISTFVGYLTTNPFLYS